MNQRIKDFTGKESDKSKVYLNPDEPATKVLLDKLAYHETQINFHRREASEINRILELMDRYGVTKHIPGTIGAVPNRMIFDGPTGISYSIEDMKRRDFWMSRAVDYIRSCGILVQTADIFASVGVKTTEVERRSIMSTLSLVMADLCEQGLLKKYKVEGKKGFYYGTPEMFNGEMPIVEF